MRLQPKGIPDPADRHVRMADSHRHRTDRPMGRIGWQRLKLALYHGCELLVANHARPARAWLIQQRRPARAGVGIRLASGSSHARTQGRISTKLSQYQQRRSDRAACDNPRHGNIHHVVISKHTFS